MHTVIAAEALFFVLAFAKGAGIMLGYDILRAFRRGFPHGGRLVAAEDFFYWVFAWIFVFLMFRDRNYGQIRGYVLAALILGMLFYILLFSRRILLVFSTFFRLSFPHDCRSFPADFDACRKIGQKIEKNGQESIEKEDKTG